MFDETEQERILVARRMAHKLAHNKSKKRIVRKLPQSMVIVPTVGVKRAYSVRRLINENKRLSYIVLLGAVMCAYMYDVDQDTLELMVNSVTGEAQKHLGGLMGMS